MFVFRNLHKHTIKNVLKGSDVLHPVYTNLCIARFLNYSPNLYEHDRDPAPVYFNSDVQALLKSLTRVNLGIVYKKRKLGDKALEQPTYRFMTDEQLQETLTEAKQRVDDFLQMPPVMQVRKPINKVFIQDTALQGLETSKLIFTDVTFGVKDCDRLIVVREPDGTLKEASWDVRDRMNQVYFPKICRKLKMPRMFEDENLQNLLTSKEYEFILDRACAQFEPNHPDYQRVTSMTYQHINDNDGFEKLRSTRHFGPLAFYLAWFKNIDNLLLELIETAHIEDCNSLLQLYGKIHKVEFKIENPQSLEGILQYIALEAQKKGPLELAVQAYRDLEKQRSELRSGIQAAHGLT